VFEVFFDVGAALGAHGRASLLLMAGDRYRTTSQHVLTKRPTKKMHVKKWIFSDELKGIMWAFTPALPKFNQAVRERVNWVNLRLSKI
jgi:hypothetical protein